MRLIGVRLIAITDVNYEEAHMLRVAGQLATRFGEHLAIQLRLQHGAQSGIACREFALRMRDAVRPLGAKMIVNRDLELAKQIDADGVHGAPLAEVLPASFVIRSVPVHDRNELARAKACAATMVLVSPIFQVAGKPAARGVEALTEARSQFSGQIIALGGVTPCNLSSCLQAGADGIAAIRAVWEQPLELTEAWLRCSSAFA